MRGVQRVLDVTLLHRYLWKRSDSHHRIVIHQVNLADQLAVSHDTVSITLKHMTEIGLLRPVETLVSNTKRYSVTPPENDQSKIQQHRMRAWG